MGYDQDYVTTTGMSVDSSLEEIQAKVLRHPSIAIGGEAMVFIYLFSPSVIIAERFES